MAGPSSWRSKSYDISRFPSPSSFLTKSNCGIVSPRLLEDLANNRQPHVAEAAKNTIKITNELAAQRLSHKNHVHEDKDS